jgi:hypothetical protein
VKEGNLNLLFSGQISSFALVTRCMNAPIARPKQVIHLTLCVVLVLALLQRGTDSRFTILERIFWFQNTTSTGGYVVDTLDPFVPRAIDWAASLRIIEQDFGIGEVAKLIAGHTHIKDANPLEQPMCWVGSIAKSRSDNPRLALCVNAIKEIVAAMRDDRRRLRREISTSVEVQGEMANRFPKLMIHPDERLVAHNRCAEFIAPITPNSPMKLDEGGGVNKASITIGSEKDKDQLAKELFVPDALALAKAFLSRLPGGRAFGIAAILYII